MSPEGTWVVGVDIGGTNVKLVAARQAVPPAGLAGVDDLGPPRSAAFPTEASDPEALLGRISAGIARLTEAQPAAVGVALPGNVDRAAGTALYVPALGEPWAGYPVAKQLGALAGAPVVLLNDVHAMTLAEATVGAARGGEDVLCVAVGTGVGGGLVVGGRPHTGASGTAGAIGHTTVEPDGLRCVCGNRGCVEAYASGPAIAAQAGHTTSEAAAAAARRGEADAVEAFARAGRYLGIAVANVVTMLSPSKVVIGGGVGSAGDLLLHPLRTELRERVRVVSLSTTEVVPAACGTDAGALGAALAAMSALGIEQDRSEQDHGHKTG